MSNIFQQKILNKRTAVFIMASLLIGFLFDIYKWYEMPSANNFYAGTFFTLIYVCIDIFMMHKILGIDVDSCLNRFFSPVKNNMRHLMLFSTLLIPSSFYFQGSLKFFSVVVLSIAAGDLYLYSKQDPQKQLPTECVD